jgi:hypothetical protein
LFGTHIFPKQFLIAKFADSRPSNKTSSPTTKTLLCGPPGLVRNLKAHQEQAIRVVSPTFSRASFHFSFVFLSQGTMFSFLVVVVVALYFFLWCLPPFFLSFFRFLCIFFIYYPSLAVLYVLRIIACISLFVLSLALLLTLLSFLRDVFFSLAPPARWSLFSNLNQSPF